MVEYRRANMNDTIELAKIRMEFMKEVGKIESSVNDIKIEEAIIEYLNRAILHNQFIAWLAVDNGNIIATSGLCFYEVPPSYKIPTGKVAYIMNMFTKHTYRGKGIATILFDKILGEAKNLGYTRITLNATEMGKPLYTRFGFVDVEGDMVYKPK